MDVNRLKTKRSTVRQLITKLITNIEGAISTQDENQTEILYDFKNRLDDKGKELKELDNLIEPLIPEKELESDIISSDNYREKIISCRTKIDRAILLLEKKTNINQQTESNPEFSRSKINERAVKTESNVLKLPKLNISVFSGADCSEWLNFWNTFEVAIHNNDALSKIEKFTYLKAYLKGSALTSVSGFALTDKNYDSSILLLKERFGRTELIISSHMNKLLSIEPVKSVFNVPALRKMYDLIEIQVRSLESLGITSGTYSNLLCPIIIQKIPEELNLLYNRTISTNELFDIKSLIEFLRKEIECRETSHILGNQRNTRETQGHKPVNNNNYYKSRHPFNQNRNISTTSALVASAESQNCTFCSKNHLDKLCPLSVNEKKRNLMSQGKCFICFNRRHRANGCWRIDKKCQNCNRAHNTLICDSEQSNSGAVKSNQNSSNSESKPNAEKSLLCNENKIKREDYSAVILQTFNATVEAKKGRKFLLHCLCDGGSSRSFLVKETADLLGLKVIRQETLLIYTFGNNKPKEKTYDVVEVILENRTNASQKIKIKALVIDSITLGHIEAPSQWVRQLAQERELELADLGNSNEVNVLIGADYMWEVLGEKIVRLSKRLVACESIFGYILQGKNDEHKSKNVHFSYLTIAQEQMDFKIVKSLWDLETIGINLERETPKSDLEILENFERNTTYEKNRYETRLLWKEDVEEINNNYEVAKRRLVSLNNSFKQNHNLYEKYKEIINEQLADEIIEPVELDNAKQCVGYFMPHHAVIRELKETTKVRVCYDASSKTKDELSLNECLHSGPNLNPDLLRVIIKFRFHHIAFCADIQRAFLEIGINEDDRKYLQFLWGAEAESNLNLFDRGLRALRMKRVPFGVKCSPFLLAATIRLHLKKYKQAYPESCAVLDELYVDDLINGAESVEKAAVISCDAKNILKEASMNLRQWATNSQELCDIFKENKFECRKSTKELGVPLKILGMIWDNEDDTLRIELCQFEKLKSEICTKRIVLKSAGMLFDPIGLLNPFTIRIKLILQELWERGISWDEPIPPDLELKYKQWLDEVSYASNIIIPRVYFKEKNETRLELHIFSDASPKCYGSVAYFRAVYPNKTETSFVVSKSRLAPLKSMTIPRLEIMGCLISARLSLYLRQTFSFVDDCNIFYWCDSQICIYWIKNKSGHLKQFVKNRVTEIKEKTNPENWNFCNGKINPADKLTRGLSIFNLMNDEEWLTGPIWLSDHNIHQSDMKFSEDVIEEAERETREVTVLLQTFQEPNDLLFDIQKYSDLNKMLRVTVYVMRFVKNCKPNAEKLKGIISAEELENSEKYWVRYVQRIVFQKEYLQLQNSLPISPMSKLYSLNPILSPDGIIYLAGRLQSSSFQFSEKHPWILPSKHHFTELLIMREHKGLGHSGVSDTLTQIREKYWIIRGRQSVKSCLARCLICKRYNVKAGRQVVAPLPPERICAESAFENVGVDFAGPLYTKGNDKAYIALFTCAVTRAIHLELVSSLSTEHFLLCFRRFVSRRGVCKTINSDNALTFKGADRELKTLYMNLKDPDIQNYFSKRGISWHYIVERAAWWGGFWERMVRITKLSIKKILGKALVSYEELETVLVEIESIINSRPLTYVFNEPNEPFPLTPSNFLVGKRLTALPQWTGSHTNSVSSKKVVLKRYLYREKMLSNFWKRWKSEYLLLLKNANVFNPVNISTEFKVNDIVLISEDKLPRQTWKLGRVMEVHLGRDHQVRAVTLKTATGILKRPIQLLYNLELDVSG